jgi:ankyrin repeat protein
LNELPPTLDGTYKRVLEEIPEEKKQHALRLFQFLVAAVRPLRVEELAESFTMEFDLDMATHFREDWRSETPEDDIISTCSTLITVIDDKGSKTVQFSHYSVKEFLTSERLQISEVGNIRHFHISLDTAHTILARACLAVLLQLDESIDKDRLATFPLAFYAAQKWFVHAKPKEVAPRLQDAMNQLFNPKQPHLAAWLWICDVELGWIRDINTLTRPSPPNATALYYAVSCGLCGPAEYLISTHGEDVNARCGSDGSPLHTASRKGHLDSVSLFLDHGADVNITNEWKETPLCAAYAGRQLEVMRHLLGRGATVDIPYNSIGRLIHNASWDGQAEVLSLLLQHGSDVNGTGWSNQTPLHFASTQGRVDIVQILLDHGSDINAVSDQGTSLYYALHCRRLKVIRLLLKHGADVHVCAPGHRTPFQVAANDECTQMARLLLEHRADEG